MTAILALIGPKVIGILAAIVAALAWGFQQRIAGAKAERNKQKAKEADSLEKHLDELSDAHIARNSVDGRLPDDDPYRRD